MQTTQGAYPEPAHPAARDLERLTQGVLSRRLGAYLVDLAVIFGLTLVVGAAVSVLGILTFGLAWLLFAILVPGTAILYSALTVGGRNGATIGMRLAGVRVVDAHRGTGVDPLVAGVHALLFYVAAGTFVLLVVDVLIGLVRSDRRMGHDVLAGIVTIRR
jgi:uncharacterized RDD family membrane protein YckC